MQEVFPQNYRNHVGRLVGTNLERTCLDIKLSRATWKSHHVITSVPTQTMKRAMNRARRPCRAALRHVGRCRRSHAALAGARAAGRALRLTGRCVMCFPQQAAHESNNAIATARSTHNTEARHHGSSQRPPRPAASRAPSFATSHIG
eukprot:6420539-Prymnesium_polylepis.3